VISWGRVYLFPRFYMPDISHFAAIPIGIITYNFSVINYIFS
jgi:hypothetical protein